MPALAPCWQLSSDAGPAQCHLRSKEDQIPGPLGHCQEVESKNDITYVSIGARNPLQERGSGEGNTSGQPGGGGPSSRTRGDIWPKMPPYLAWGQPLSLSGRVPLPTLGSHCRTQHSSSEVQPSLVTPLMQPKATPGLSQGAGRGQGAKLTWCDHTRRRPPSLGAGFAKPRARW